MKRRTKRITVLVYRVGKAGSVEQIDDDLKSMQNVVGGNIEGIFLSRERSSLMLYCNENGKYENLPPNRLCALDVIVGDFFVAKHSSSGNAISMTEQDIEFARKVVESWPAL